MNTVVCVAIRRSRRLLVASTAPFAAAFAQSIAPVREIAVTFDDLPIASHALENDIRAQNVVTERLLEALSLVHVPAIGFVNAGRFAPHGPMEPARIAVLQQWIDAGQALGNHSYSHLDFHETTVARYAADVEHGDSLIRALLGAAHRPPPVWFRHPFLHTGRDSAARARFERGLAELGLSVAPVTVNSDEYLYAARYDRLAARHDSAAMREVAAAYVSYMTQVMERCERQSNALFGREIRQILLLHANVLNADHFGELARMLQARGYRFIPIERAMEDPAYRTPDRYYGPDGLSWLGRWAKAAPPAEFAPGGSISLLGRSPAPSCGGGTDRAPARNAHCLSKTATLWNATPFALYPICSDVVVLPSFDTTVRSIRTTTPPLLLTEMSV